MFLIDEGRHMYVSYDKILPLPEAYKSLNPLAFKISVYGVLPLTKDWSCDESMKIVTKSVNFIFNIN